MMKAQHIYKERMDAAAARIKAMDELDKKHGAASPMSAVENMNVAFAAMDSGDKHAMDEALVYAFHAGITAVVMPKSTNESQPANSND